jgi:hypothetical protein
MPIEDKMAMSLKVNHPGSLKISYCGEGLGFPKTKKVVILKGVRL